MKKCIHLLFISALAAIIALFTSCNTSVKDSENDKQRIQDSLDHIQSETDKSFKATMQEADSLFEIEEYEQAIEKYETALQYTEDSNKKTEIEQTIVICKENIDYANSPIGKTEKLLLGKKVFGVQFIWDGYGTATITKSGDLLHITGMQFSKDETEFTKLDGDITIIDERKIQIKGRLQLYTHDCCGLIDKTGTFTFIKSGSRKYWRWQDYDSYCSKYTCAYYLDIFE